MKKLKVSDEIKRYRVHITGYVQGVGFRPTIYKIANRNNLAGWVANTTDGALLEVEGKEDRIVEFLRNLKNNLPSISKINRIEIRKVKPEGQRFFSIVQSRTGKIKEAFILPDIAVCSECLKELFDKKDRRYLYPFINCTNCGPRFTIIKGVPYDREKTTMKEFKMCSECYKEYNDPLDRRFHAQPNACSICGPEVELLKSPRLLRATEKERDFRLRGKEAVETAVKLLKKGKILAIKSLGGFHLVCNAFDDNTVRKLRTRKYREDKPFALMSVKVDVIKKYCYISKEEEKLLLSKERPIVLLEKKNKKSDISEHVAPLNKYFGFFLPYTPLHHLLFKDAKDMVYVMTSGNISDEPICYKNEDAIERLSNIADYFLLNNRDIYIRCDDSVVRYVKLRMVNKKTGTVYFIRRSRGYVPLSIKSPDKFSEHILTCGAELKNTFSLAKGDEIYVSHHIGDLENLQTFIAFKEGIEHFKKLFNIQPEVIGFDMHPEYLSTKYAKELLKNNKNLKGIPVQHHHAHIMACMAENNIRDEEIIGVAFDGLGFGDDGNFWGGEFLVCNYKYYKRYFHFEYVPLPGGNKAVKEPWRMACVYLYNAFGNDFIKLNIEFIKKIEKNKLLMIKNIIDTQTNTYLISSAGRLFDAISSMLDLCYVNNYEGESAILLEQICDGQTHEFYKYEIINKGDFYNICFRETIKSIVDDILAGVKNEIISKKFHNTLIKIVLDVCKFIEKDTGIRKVALSGGVFQNIVLLKGIYEVLSRDGFKVLIHSKLPPNDACISFGQLFKK